MLTSAIFSGQIFFEPRHVWMFCYTVLLLGASSSWPAHWLFVEMQQMLVVTDDMLPAPEGVEVAEMLNDCCVLTLGWTGVLRS